MKSFAKKKPLTQDEKIDLVSAGFGITASALVMSLIVGSGIIVWKQATIDVLRSNLKNSDPAMYKKYWG